MIVMRDKFTWAFFIFTKQLWTTRPLSVSLRASSLFWIVTTWLLLLPLSSFTEQSWTDFNLFFNFTLFSSSSSSSSQAEETKQYWKVVSWLSDLRWMDSCNSFIKDSSRLRRSWKESSLFDFNKILFESLPNNGILIINL